MSNLSNVNIVLCGFMGSGKTTVGEMLAERTGRVFMDTDKYIEESQKMEIPEIFSRQGEEYFRYLEYRACCDLAKLNNLVISTGGGALTFKRNAEVLGKTGEIILLDASLETLWERLKDDTTRPLLQRENKKQIMRDLYERRLPFYRENSTMRVDASASPEEVCSQILSLLEEKYAKTEKAD